MKPLRLLALALLVTLPARGVEPRLFYSSAERARVTADRLAMLARETLAGASPQVSVVPAASESPGPDTPDIARAPAGPPRLEGITVTRDGRAHAWIGGRHYRDGELFQGQRLRVLRNGVQLLGAAGPGRLHRVGEAIRKAPRE